MAIEEISGVALSGIDGVNGVAMASIKSIGGVERSATGGIVTTNLVHKYTAASYSGSGNWLDEVGSRDVVVGGPTFSSTTPANFDCDGVNDYLLSTSTFTRADTDLSFAAWIRPHSSSGIIGQTGIIASAGRGAWMIRYNGYLYFYYRSSRGQTFASSGVSIPNNAWTYICYSRNASTRNGRLFRFNSSASGQILSTTTVLGSSNSSQYIVGAGQLYRYNGQQGNMHFYDDDLGLTEWTQNFNAQKANYGL
ncbi:LamG domain-containing protein [bacterium]|nr:LamG domain-containing protein [bacterium]